MGRLPPEGTRWALALALGALLTGCGGGCDELWYADLDGDGFGDPETAQWACAPPEATVGNGRDCDDGDPSIHPEAGERCNAIDDDCDGHVDVDVALVWYLDRDADGWGDDASSIEGCDPPAHYVDQPGDCDDLAPDAHPGGVEVCNHVDDDCNGLVDDDAADPRTWYRDADEDGFGDPATGAPHCSAPTGWTLDASDCDDGDPGIHPDADEVCNDVDDDCDGAVDDDDPQGADDAIAWYFDGDGDGFGTPAVVASSCASPGPGWVPSSGDCDDADAEVAPGALETCAPGDEDCDGLHDASDPSIDPGSLLPFWSDLDGDGLGAGTARWSCAPRVGEVDNALDCDDGAALIGADTWRADGDGDGVGAGPVVGGSGCSAPGPGFANAAGPEDCDDLDPDRAPGFVDVCGDGVDQDCTSFDAVCPPPLAGTRTTADASALRRGSTTGDHLGVAIAAGDLDGDGRRDLAVGAPDENRLVQVPGAVHLLAGPPPELLGAWNAAATALGDVSLAWTGAALAGAGDLDGDGHDDLVVGAPSRNAATDGGAVALLRGGPQMPATFALVAIGGAADHRFGAAVAAIGDVDGDGVGLILAGAPLDAVGGIGAGAAYLLDADVSAGAAELDATLILRGVVGDGLGGAVALGDLDGDGVPEVVVGAPGGARALVFDGAATGTLDPTLALATATGPVGSRAGAALDVGDLDVGDLDGDGLLDLLIAGPDASGAGAVWRIGLGDVALDLAPDVISGVVGDQLGASVATAGDVDGDGTTDLIVGVPGAGRALVYHGPLVGQLDATHAAATLVGDADFGAAVAGPGDLDGDGLDDVVVGAPGHDLPASEAGGVWVFRGF